MVRRRKTRRGEEERCLSPWGEREKGIRARRVRDAKERLHARGPRRRRRPRSRRSGSSSVEASWRLCGRVLKRSLRGPGASLAFWLVYPVIPVGAVPSRTQRSGREPANEKIVWRRPMTCGRAAPRALARAGAPGPPRGAKLQIDAQGYLRRAPRQRSKFRAERRAWVSLGRRGLTLESLAV